MARSPDPAKCSQERCTTVQAARLKCHAAVQANCHVLPLSNGCWCGRTPKSSYQHETKGINTKRIQSMCIDTNMLSVASSSCLYFPAFAARKFHPLTEQTSPCSIRPFSFCPWHPRIPLGRVVCHAELRLCTHGRLAIHMCQGHSSHPLCIVPYTSDHQ